MDTSKKVSAKQGNDEDVIDLRELFYVLLDHLVLIIVCLLLGALLGFGISKYVITPQYTATSSLYIGTSSDSVVDLSSLQISTQLTSDYQELVTSPTLLEEVIGDLGLDMTYGELENMISIDNPSDTRILNISVTTSDPQLSADISNQLASQAKIDLPLIMNSEEPYQFEKARVPSSPSSPSVSKWTMIGGLLGAVGCMGILIVIYLWNDTYVTAQDIQKEFNVQPLTAVPNASIPALDGKKDARIKKKGKRFKL